VSKVSVELDFKQIESMVERLDTNSKIKLINKIARQTRKDRWGRLADNIRKQFAKGPISEQEITRICTKVRRERYEKGGKLIMVRKLVSVGVFFFVVGVSLSLYANSYKDTARLISKANGLIDKALSSQDCDYYFEVDKDLNKEVARKVSRFKNKEKQALGYMILGYCYAKMKNKGKYFDAPTWNREKASVWRAPGKGKKDKWNSLDRAIKYFEQADNCIKELPSKSKGNIYFLLGIGYDSLRLQVEEKDKEKRNKLHKRALEYFKRASDNKTEIKDAARLVSMYKGLDPLLNKSPFSSSQLGELTNNLINIILGGLESSKLWGMVTYKGCACSW